MFERPKVSRQEFLSISAQAVQKFEFEAELVSSRLYARCQFDEHRSIALCFKLGLRSSYECLVDFHHLQQIAWLDRILGRKQKTWQSWVYLQRLLVRIPDQDEGGKLFEEDIDYGIESKSGLRRFSRSLSRDLPDRILPAFSKLKLTDGLDSEHWLRYRTMTFGGVPVGAAGLRGHNAGLARNMYWWRGGFIDLAALLVLEDRKRAKWLIKRMPQKIDTLQTYLTDLDRLSVKQWMRARQNAEEILAEL